MRPTMLCLALASCCGISVARAESARDTGIPDAGPWCEYDEPGIDPAAGEIPSNWPLFRVHLRGGERLDWDAVRLVRVADATEVPIVTSRLGPIASIAPREDLIVGEEYDLHHPICPTEAARVTRYRAIAPVDAPLGLGAIEISELFAANTERGSAYRMYFVEVRLSPDPRLATEPWASTLQWATEVDDDDSYTAQPIDELAERLYVDCGAGSGLTPGDHTFRGVAFALPGAIRFVTPEVGSAIAPCESATRVDWETLRPLTPDEIEYWDHAPMDGGSVGAIDGGLDGGRMGMMTEPDTDTSCAITSGRGSRLAPWALLVAAIALSRRRARR